MDLIPSEGFAIQSKSRWPNTIVFPKELRDAIPEYGSRALVFDSVSGSRSKAPVSISGMIGEAQVDFGTRTQIRFLVHETGKLDGGSLLCWLTWIRKQLGLWGDFWSGLRIRPTTKVNPRPNKCGTSSA